MPEDPLRPEGEPLASGLSAACVALLDQERNAERTHPTSGDIVWRFGRFGPDRDPRRLGLSATGPGMYAENLASDLGIPVAQSEDGDLLMAQDGGFLVSILRHGSMRLESLNRSLDDWLAEATDADPAPPAPSGDDRPELHGRWKAVSSRTLDDERLSALAERELCPEGVLLMRWTVPFDMESAGRWYCIGDDHVVLQYDDSWSAWHVEVLGSNALRWTGPAPDGDSVVFERVR